MQRQSKYVRWQEIQRLAPRLTSNQWYSLVARGRVPGVERKADGWGYLVPRRAFMAWIAEHPEFTAQPAEPVEIG